MSTGYRPRCNRDHPGRSEVIIGTRRLAELEAKERSHDDYLAAVRQWHQRAPKAGEYRQAVLDLSQLIVDTAARRMA